MDAIVLDAPVDLATETASQLFLGRDHGGVGVSFFMNHTAPGGGVRAHRHPYAEVFVVHAGEAMFTVDGVEHPGRGGHVIVVPAGAAHGFRNTGARTLEMTSIHDAADMETEWIEEGELMDASAEKA